MIQGKLNPCPIKEINTLPKTEAINRSHPGSVGGMLKANAIDREPLILPKTAHLDGSDHRLTLYVRLELLR